MVITCDVVKLAFPNCPGCCWSCHEDADEGYDSCLNSGGDFAVCCAVGDFLSKNDIDQWEDVDDPDLIRAYNAKYGTH